MSLGFGGDRKCHRDASLSGLFQELLTSEHFPFRRCAVSRGGGHILRLCVSYLAPIQASQWAVFHFTLSNKWGHTAREQRRKAGAVCRVRSEPPILRQLHTLHSSAQESPGNRCRKECPFL